MKDDAEKLFLENLETTNRAIRFASRRASMSSDEADDFMSWVQLKLIEKDYAVLRKYEGRSTFSAFISVVVQRMLLDYRIAQWGKWHASADAKRLGELAVTIEAMMHRDRRSIDEILPCLIRRWPEATREGVEVIVRKLPPRTPRAREIAMESAAKALSTLAGPEDDFLVDQERAEVAHKVAAIVRDVMDALEEDDRLIFRLRFSGEMSVAEISRTLRIEQKPLYRRLQRALTSLRKRLEAAGISASDAEEIVRARDTVLDFGFEEGTRSSRRPELEGEDA